MNIPETVFFFSLFMVFFAYFGYPLTLLLLRRLDKRITLRKSITPSVTLIITAFNEERRIMEKLENTLKLDYPFENLQILIASDGSTDQTNDIVRSYENMGVELLEVKERKGKENAQKEAVARARGEIIVFSDVATILNPEGLKEIVSNFADPAVGCVSSEDRVIGKDGKSSGEGFYVKYEMWLRHLESEVNSVVGLSGSFFAARREVCQDFSGYMQSDFRTLLSSIKLGMRGVSDPNALGYYSDIADEHREFERKTRTVLRGLTVFFQHLKFLNLFKYGFFSYQLFCHKLMRWMVPFFLFGLLVGNLLSAFSSTVFAILLICQIAFYATAVLGWITQSLRGVLKIPMFFLIANTAIAVAWYRYLTGKRVVLWTPSQR